MQPSPQTKKAPSGATLEAFDKFPQTKGNKMYNISNVLPKDNNLLADIAKKGDKITLKDLDDCVDAAKDELFAARSLALSLMALAKMGPDRDYTDALLVMPQLIADYTNKSIKILDQVEISAMKIEGAQS